MILNQGQSVDIFLVPGQVLNLSGNGSFIFVGRDGEPDEYVQFNNWTTTVGPLSNPRQGTLYCNAGPDLTVEYSITAKPEVAANWVRLLADELPENGREGVLYVTEAGVRWWSDVSGEYLEFDGAPSVPENTSPPVIAGDAEIGATLTVVDHGEWDHRPTSFLYQWEVDGSEVEGATDRSFVVPSEAEGEDVECFVTGVNDAGEAESSTGSNAIGPIVDPDD